MKLCLDNANVKNTQEVAGFGVLSDVTRNLSLMAIVRHHQHVVQADFAGGHICTMPSVCVQEDIKHPLTDLSVTKFLADWNAQLHQ